MIQVKNYNIRQTQFENPNKSGESSETGEINGTGELPDFMQPVMKGTYEFSYRRKGESEKRNGWMKLYQEHDIGWQNLTGMVVNLAQIHISIRSGNNIITRLPIDITTKPKLVQHIVKDKVTGQRHLQENHPGWEYQKQVEAAEFLKASIGHVIALHEMGQLHPNSDNSANRVKYVDIVVDHVIKKLEIAIRQI